VLFDNVLTDNILVSGCRTRDNAKERVIVNERMKSFTSIAFALSRGMTKTNIFVSIFVTAESVNILSFKHPSSDKDFLLVTISYRCTLSKARF